MAHKCLLRCFTTIIIIRQIKTADLWKPLTLKKYFCLQVPVDGTDEMWKTHYFVCLDDIMTPAPLVCFYDYYYKSLPISKHICELETSPGPERRALGAKCCDSEWRGLTGSRRCCQISLQETVRFDKNIHPDIILSCMLI